MQNALVAVSRNVEVWCSVQRIVGDIVGELPIVAGRSGAGGPDKFERSAVVMNGDGTEINWLACAQWRLCVEVQPIVVDVKEGEVEEAKDGDYEPGAERTTIDLTPCRFAYARIQGCVIVHHSRSMTRP